VVVRPLREHPEFVAELARLFEQEWPEWYGASRRGDAMQDLSAFANPEGVLPVGVVALSEAGQPCGVAALKASSIAEYSHLSPWAAAGFVLPRLRGQGIGASLLSALLVEANRLGYSSVYCATSTAKSLLHRVGWQFVEQTVHDEKPMFLFRSGAA
jgi:GNAT superfamily N-acetyltransferase